MTFASNEDGMYIVHQDFISHAYFTEQAEEHWDVMLPHIDLLNTSKTCFSIDAENSKYLQRFSRVQRVQDLIARSNVNFELVFKFPYLWHVENLQVWKTDFGKSFQDVRNAIRMSPSDLDIQWIQLKIEDFYRVLELIAHLNIEKANLKIWIEDKGKLEVQKIPAILKDNLILWELVVWNAGQYLKFSDKIFR